MINKKYEMILFRILMSLGMSLSMSFILIMINVGLETITLKDFFRAWMLSFSISLPISYVISIAAKKIASKLVE